MKRKGYRPAEKYMWLSPHFIMLTRPNGEETAMMDPKTNKALGFRSRKGAILHLKKVGLFGKEGIHIEQFKTGG